MSYIQVAAIYLIPRHDKEHWRNPAHMHRLTHIELLKTFMHRKSRNKYLLDNQTDETELRKNISYTIFQDAFSSPLSFVSGHLRLMLISFLNCICGLSLMEFSL